MPETHCVPSRSRLTISPNWFPLEVQQPYPNVNSESSDVWKYERCYGRLAKSLFQRQWEWITNSFRRENVNRHRRLTNFMVTQNSNAWKLPTWFLCVCSLPDANIHPMGRERRKSNRHTLSLSRMQIALISQSIQRSLSPPRCTKIRRCSKMI